MNPFNHNGMPPLSMPLLLAMPGKLAKNFLTRQIRQLKKMQMSKSTITYEHSLNGNIIEIFHFNMIVH